MVLLSDSEYGVSLLASIDQNVTRIARMLEAVAYQQTVVHQGERRWWCAVDNEFGSKGEPHPYCAAGAGGAHLHRNCGWGTWTREGRG